MRKRTQQGNEREKRFPYAVRKRQTKNRTLEFPALVPRILVKDIVYILGIVTEASQLGAQGIRLQIGAVIVAFLNCDNTDTFHKASINRASGRAF